MVIKTTNELINLNQYQNIRIRNCENEFAPIYIHIDYYNDNGYAQIGPFEKIKEARKCLEIICNKILSNTEVIDISEFI